MLLKNILESVRVGSDEYNTMNTVLELEENFSEDTNNYKTYNVIKNSVSNLYVKKNDINENLLSSIMKISGKIKDIEKKDDMSKSYARMKYDSLAESYNKTITILENRSILRSVDKDEIAKVLAIVNYNLLKLQEISNAPSKVLNEVSETLKPYFNKQVKVIIETIL